MATVEFIHIGLDSPHDNVSLNSWSWYDDAAILRIFFFFRRRASICSILPWSSATLLRKRSNPFTPTVRMAKIFCVSSQSTEVHLFLSQTRVWARVNTYLWSLWTFGIFTSSLRDTSDGQRPQLCCHAHGNLSFINRLLEFAVKKAATALTSWTSDLLQYSVSPGKLFQVIEGTKQIRLTAFSKMKRSL